MNMATVTKKSGMIVLPTRISHVLVEATNEPRVDIALNIVINDFLERRLEEATKKIEAFEDSTTHRKCDKVTFKHFLVNVKEFLK